MNTTAAASNDNNNSTESALIGGIVGGIVALLLLIALIAFIVFKRNRRDKTDQNVGHPLQSPEPNGRIASQNQYDNLSNVRNNANTYHHYDDVHTALT
jgi:hypothetical protein